MTTDLSARLSEQENIIQGWVDSAPNAGTALAIIRDDKLYGDSTFESYCKNRWGFSKSHAYRLIDAAEILERVAPVAKTSPMGDAIPSPKTSPTGDVPSERQLRPLAKLPKEEQAPAFEEAKEAAEAEGKPLTAKQVQEVVARRMEKAIVPAEGPIETKANQDPCRAVAQEMAAFAKEIETIEKRLRAFLTPQKQDWKAHLTQRDILWGLTKVRRNLKEQAPTGGDPQNPNTVLMGQVATASNDGGAAA